MDNQRGLATLEMILIVLIIAILATVAVPKMARMIDVAQVDYEMKKFIRTVDFTNSLSKNVSYKKEAFAYDTSVTIPPSQLQIDIDDDLNRYTIRSNMEDVFEPYYLPKDFSIRVEKGELRHIYFPQRKTGHIAITSRYGVKRYIYFDSVGRWSGDIRERYN